MKYKCLIVDDEKPARDLIKKFSEKIPELEIIDTCENVLIAKSVLSKNNIDILFLDIQMPDINGIEFLRLLKDIPATILITAYSEYALEGYELEIVDYLLKPVEFERFYRAVNKAIKQIDKTSGIKKQSLEKSEKSIFVKADKEILKLNINNILFIESMREYVQIHTSNKKIITLQALSKFMDVLPETFFFRVHRSYIVNIEAIDKIIGNTIFIKGHQIPISRGQKDLFIDTINKNKLF